MQNNFITIIIIIFYELNFQKENYRIKFYHEKKLH